MRFGSFPISLLRVLRIIDFHYLSLYLCVFFYDNGRTVLYNIEKKTIKMYGQMRVCWKNTVNSDEVAIFA